MQVNCCVSCWLITGSELTNHPQNGLLTMASQHTFGFAYCVGGEKRCEGADLLTFVSRCSLFACDSSTLGFQSTLVIARQLKTTFFFSVACLKQDGVQDSQDSYRYHHRDIRDQTSPNARPRRSHYKREIRACYNERT